MHSHAQPVDRYDARTFLMCRDSRCRWGSRARYRAFAGSAARMFTKCRQENSWVRTTPMGDRVAFAAVVGDAPAARIRMTRSLAPSTGDPRTLTRAGQRRPA